MTVEQPFVRATEIQTNKYAVRDARDGGAGKFADVDCGHLCQGISLRIPFHEVFDDLPFGFGAQIPSPKSASSTMAGNILAEFGCQQ